MLIEPRKLPCPWCGELNTVMLDVTLEDGEFVEDCAVCCAPILYAVRTELETDCRQIWCRKENE